MPLVCWDGRFPVSDGEEEVQVDVGEWVGMRAQDRDRLGSNKHAHKMSARVIFDGRWGIRDRCVWCRVASYQDGRPRVSDRKPFPGDVWPENEGEQERGGRGAVKPDVCDTPGLAVSLAEVALIVVAAARQEGTFSNRWDAVDEP